MRKADLKDGMICEMRDGTRGIWLGGEVKRIDAHPLIVRDDLTSCCFPAHDIVKVYDPPEAGNIEDRRAGKLVWERSKTAATDNRNEKEPISSMTVIKLLHKLREDGRIPTCIEENYSALKDLLRSQKEFDIQTQGINEMIEIVFKRTCYARSLAGYFAALYESGYITEAEYQQVTMDAGVVRYV